MGSPGPFTIFTIFISPRYKTARPKAGVLTGTNSCTATLVVDFMATLVHDGQGPDGFLPPWGSPEGMDALRQQLAQCLKTGAVDRCRSIVNCRYMSIQCILYIIYNSIYAIVLGLIFEFQHPRYPRSMQPLGPQDLPTGSKLLTQFSSALVTALMQMISGCTAMAVVWNVLMALLQAVPFSQAEIAALRPVLGRTKSPKSKLPGPA